jgi:hypothetical protein
MATLRAALSRLSSHTAQFQTTVEASASNPSPVILRIMSTSSPAVHRAARVTFDKMSIFPISKSQSHAPSGIVLSQAPVRICKFMRKLDLNIALAVLATTLERRRIGLLSQVLLTRSEAVPLQPTCG